MKIDENVEPLVRAALDAAVSRDTARFEAAMAGFSTGAQLQSGVELAVAISAAVLFDIHQGTPSRAEIQELAQDISRQEEWLAPTGEEIAAFLQAVSDRRPLAAVLPADGVVVLPFIVGANLLATSATPERGEWWFTYLDKVEAAIEAAG